MKGYFGIGVENVSKAMNAGAVMRTAHAFGANFSFFVGGPLNKYEIRLSASAHPTPGQHKQNGGLVSFPADPSYAGGWNSKGETMTDTTLNGQVELRKQFGADDYAAQIMPTGSPEVEGAYQLMIYRD